MIEKIAVVTGATGGIGRWIARGLAGAGYHVVLVGRDAGRGQATAAWIASGVPGASIAPMQADLASLAETRALGAEIARRHPAVSLLVTNAGIFLDKRQVTHEGHERVLAVNHLSPFVLANSLQDALKAGAPSRLVSIGSDTSDAATIDPDNLELTRGWNFVSAYRRSKLAQMMTVFAMAERLKETGVTANVVHPGAVASGLVRAPGAIGLAWKIMAPFLLSEEHGADTPVYVATSPDVAGITGRYFKRREIVPANPLARDPALAGRVWEATERLVGIA